MHCLPTPLFERANAAFGEIIAQRVAATGFNLIVLKNIELIADHLSELGHHLIIEFVPKKDPQVKRLLSCREDIFENYNQSSFEAAFGRHFVIEQHSEVGNDGRVLYLMKTKEVSVALNSAA